MGTDGTSQCDCRGRNGTHGTRLRMHVDDVGRGTFVTDVLRHDAAIAAATTVWTVDSAVVLPLTAALPSIHGARLCSEARGRHRRLSWLDEPVVQRRPRWFSFGN